MADVSELKNLVLQTLDSKGVLSKLKAQLRASVFSALEEQEKASGIHLENSVAERVRATADSLLLAELVAEYLQCMDLEYTYNVFTAEASLSKSIKPRSALASELQVHNSPSSSSRPLLFEILSEWKHHSSSVPSSASSSSSALDDLEHIPVKRNGLPLLSSKPIPSFSSSSSSSSSSSLSPASAPSSILSKPQASSQQQQQIQQNQKVAESLHSSVLENEAAIEDISSTVRRIRTLGEPNVPSSSPSLLSSASQSKPAPVSSISPASSPSLSSASASLPKPSLSSVAPASPARSFPSQAFDEDELVEEEEDMPSPSASSSPGSSFHNNNSLLNNSSSLSSPKRDLAASRKILDASPSSPQSSSSRRKLGPLEPLNSRSMDSFASSASSDDFRDHLGNSTEEDFRQLQKINEHLAAMQGKNNNRNISANISISASNDSFNSSSVSLSSPSRSSPMGSPDHKQSSKSASAANSSLLMSPQQQSSSALRASNNSDAARSSDSSFKYRSDESDLYQDDHDFESVDEDISEDFESRSDIRSSSNSMGSPLNRTAALNDFSDHDARSANLSSMSYSEPVLSRDDDDDDAF